MGHGNFGDGSKRTRVLILLPNLVSGGGQRAVLNLLYGLDRSLFDPVLLIQERIGSFCPEVEGRDDVAFILDRSFKRSDLPHLIAETAKRARKADIVIAALEGRASFCGLLAAKIVRKPIITWVHIDWVPFLERVSWRQKLALMTYRFADHVVACSRGAGDNFARLFSIPSSRISTIYNGLPLDLIAKNAKEPIPVEEQALFDGPTVLTVARLDEQKGYPYLLNAHAQLMARGEKHKLLIIGEGDMFDELVQLATDLGVRDSVHFLGFKTNPHRYISKATVFVLSSLFEGFGLVLVEALKCGVPVVATDCLSGPAEVLDDGTYGRLVPVRDAAALATALSDLLKNPAERERLSALGITRAEEFDDKSKFEEWNSLLKRLAPVDRSELTPQAPVLTMKRSAE